MHAGPLIPLVRIVTLPVGSISISSSSSAMAAPTSMVTDADLDGAVGADLFVDDRHMPLLQFGDDAVVNVLLRHTADQLFADLPELRLGVPFAFNAKLQGAALIA